VESVVDLPAHGLSIAFRLACLFYPYPSSYGLRPGRARFLLIFGLYPALCLS
jgi:hypothetical protein